MLGEPSSVIKDDNLPAIGDCRPNNGWKKAGLLVKDFDRFKLLNNLVHCLILLKMEHLNFVGFR